MAVGLSSSNNGFDLLRQTKAIRAMEGGSGYFMGTMARPVTGPSGVATLGGWNLFSLLPGPTAHELGHSFNLRHAPCGGAGSPDPAYPYSGAQIGAWGYDPLGGVVPPTTTDIMSYCGGWISDYHYANALRHRLIKEGAPAAAPATALMLWGGIDADGAPFLEPAFVVDAPPTLPDSAGSHRLTGRTGSGAELFSFSFAMPEVADGDGSSGFAFAFPGRSGWEALASVTLSGPGGSVTLDGDSDRPIAILRDPRNGQVRAILRDVPDPARAQADAASALGTGPGLEVLFSRGIPSRAAWRP
ncbi:M66 family metalloprotease [Candidatus Palauibacter sp.]|uniref:M66 family metalloprotease n=1 Tax=Candidatus Palauibacter sp. TaxID=3101350 RepID=UPI003B029DC1